jgi:hypothetical protein
MVARNAINTKPIWCHVLWSFYLVYLSVSLCYSNQYDVINYDPSIYLSIYLSIYPICLSLCLSVSVCLSICLSVCLSVYLSIYLSIYLCVSVCLSIYLSVYLSIYLFVCVCLSIYLSVCLSLYLSLSIYIDTHTQIHVGYQFIKANYCSIRFIHWSKATDQANSCNHGLQNDRGCSCICPCTVVPFSVR